MNRRLSVFIALPLLTQETIVLRSKGAADPAAPPEKIQERGKDCVIDRSIFNVLPAHDYGIPTR